jgi:hypothetical protein
MRFDITFFADDYDSDSVVAVVSTIGEVELSRVLYQIGSPDLSDIQFAGGHGFTGLNVVHDESGAQLQFWCSAD